MSDGKSGNNDRMLPIVGSEKALEKTLDNDPCFGQSYAKSAEECKQCRMPVIVDGDLLLMKEVCRARCEGQDPGPLNRLTSQEVLNRISQGKSIFEIWLEVLDGKDPETGYGTDARSLLRARVCYLEEQKGLDLEDVPFTSTLRERYRNRS